MTQPLVLESLSTLPPPARLGEVLGKYRLERIVATGGMGVVVAATHLQLNQPIAIKFMSALLAENEMGVSRFLLEARAAARIRLEHVVRVHDVETLPGGAPYIVMEYLDGEDLSHLLARQGRVGISEAIDYVLQACEALAEAHVAGIVHRDLKPGNLFRCTRPDGAPLVKVLDFGVSKLLQRADSGLRANNSTGPHVIMGTPLYSAPEQLRSSSSLDARADIWALGVILHELIAGRPPFAADTFMQICAKVAYVPCPSLQSLRPEVPAELSAVVARCLAKDPGERFQTVAEFARALAPMAPRGSLLSIERAERIIGGDAKARAIDRTLRSAPVTPTLSISPSALTPRHESAPVHPLRAVLWSVAGGALGGALLVAVVAIALPRGPSRPARAAQVPPERVAATARSTPERALPERVLLQGVEPMDAQAPLEAPSAPPAAGPDAPSVESAPRPRPPPRARPVASTAGFGGLL